MRKRKFWYKKLWQSSNLVSDGRELPRYNAVDKHKANSEGLYMRKIAEDSKILL